MCVLAVIVLLEMTLNTYCAIRGRYLKVCCLFFIIGKRKFAIHYV